MKKLKKFLFHQSTMRKLIQKEEKQRKKEKIIQTWMNFDYFNYTLIGKILHQEKCYPLCAGGIKNERVENFPIFLLFCLSSHNRTHFKCLNEREFNLMKIRKSFEWGRKINFLPPFCLFEWADLMDVKRLNEQIYIVLFNNWVW